MQIIFLLFVKAVEKYECEVVASMSNSLSIFLLQPLISGMGAQRTGWVPTDVFYTFEEINKSNKKY